MKIAAPSAIAVLALAAAACGSASHGAAPTARSSSPASGSKRSGDFTYTVTKVQEEAVFTPAAAMAGSQAPAKASPGMTYVVVTVADTNDGKVAESPSGLGYADLNARGGKVYETSTTIDLESFGYTTAGGDTGGDFNPGSTITGILVYMVPATVKPLTISFPNTGVDANSNTVSGGNATVVLNLQG